MLAVRPETHVRRRRPLDSRDGAANTGWLHRTVLLLGTDKLADDPARWSYQLTLDGYRAIACNTGGRVHLRSRNDNDFSAVSEGCNAGLRSCPTRP
jgi:ATP-dependent DNA ligase